MSGYWREQAERVVAPITARWRKGEIEATEALKLIDAAYPFGERAMHPYKVWLAVRRSAKQTMGLAVKASGKRQQVGKDARQGRLGES